MSNYKDIMRKFGLVVLVIFTISEANARRNNNLNKSGGETPVLAAGCATAVAKATLELNNVRTRIEATGGSMWQDRANGVADYEVPKRGNVDDPKYTSIYAGALWMAGQDVNGQLKIAAVRYRQGNDYWTGPLTESGEAEIIPSECETCV